MIMFFSRCDVYVHRDLLIEKDGSLSMSVLSVIVLSLTFLRRRITIFADIVF